MASFKAVSPKLKLKKTWICFMHIFDNFFVFVWRLFWWNLFIIRVFFPIAFMPTDFSGFKNYDDDIRHTPSTMPTIQSKIFQLSYLQYYHLQIVQKWRSPFIRNIDILGHQPSPRLLVAHMSQYTEYTLGNRFALELLWAFWKRSKFFFSLKLELTLLAN